MKKFNLPIIFFTLLLSVAISWCTEETLDENVPIDEVGKISESDQVVDPIASEIKEEDISEPWNKDEIQELTTNDNIEDATELPDWKSDEKTNDIAEFVEDEVFTSNDLKDENVKQFQEKQEEIQKLVEVLMNEKPEMKTVQQEITKLIQQWTVEWEEFWELQKKFEWFFTDEIKKLDWEIRVLYDEIVQSQQASLTNHPKFKDYQTKWEKLQKMYQELMDKNTEMKELSWKLELLAWQWKTDSLDFQKLQARFESFLTSDMKDLEKEVTDLYKEITK